MSDRIIVIAKEFSKFPFARYKRQSDTSAEQFRDEILVPALQQHERVTINLDGTEGYGSSWLDESFGGIVRMGIYSREDLQYKLSYVSEEDPSYIDEIKQYINDAVASK
jgi:hypothetical protein